jgi:hypothetical protein
MFTIIEFGISGIGAISVAGLGCMHTWLIATMQTTNEDVSYMSHDLMLVLWCNLIIILCLD